MKSKLFALTVASTLALSINAFADCHQETSDSTDDAGNITTTYTNVCDGESSFGGTVINYADGTAQQFNSDNSLMSGWGGNQDPYTVNNVSLGDGYDLQLWTRTDSNGNSYNGGAIITGPTATYQFASPDEDGWYALINQW